MKYAFVSTEWGSFVFLAGDNGLCRTWLPTEGRRDPHRLVRRDCPHAQFDPKLLPKFQDQIENYFSGRPVRFRVPLDLSAQTVFQKKVLQTCFEIPFGEILTYTELARRSGFPKAVRAAGAVMASNPMPLVIPCHRVIRSDGGLGGFSSPGGLDLKQRLLELEGALSLQSQCA